MKNKGMFIVFEGLDGTGKTTLAKYAYDILNEKYPGKIILTCEPSKDTKLNLREIIFNEKNLLSQLFLFLADRVNHFQEVIEPALKKGKIVICDRFIDSTIVYQVDEICKKNKSSELFYLVSRLHEIIIKGIQPNYTFFIDSSFETIQKRLMERKKENNKFDNITREKYLERRDLYLSLYSNSIYKRDNIIYVKNNSNIEEAQIKIFETLGVF